MATNWGNYTDYSGPSKIPGSSTHVRDARLTLVESLIPGIFKAKTCLDIGCNAGNVSCQLAFDFGTTLVIGVDIDPNLVSQAEKLFALRSSRVLPPSNDNAAPVVDYFPISAVLTHGYRVEPHGKLADPSPSSSALAHSKWPRVRFISADWVVSSDPALLGPYHVILALSVIKWIHLEHMDHGLLSFFRRCSSSLVPGGHLIIELQTWDSYEKAVRPNTAPHFHNNFQKLEYRPETSFDELLANEGLHLCASSDSLPRRINVYRKD